MRSNYAGVFVKASWLFMIAAILVGVGGAILTLILMTRMNSFPALVEVAVLALALGVNAFMYYVMAKVFAFLADLTATLDRYDSFLVSIERRIGHTRQIAKEIQQKMDSERVRGAVFGGD